MHFLEFCCQFEWGVGRSKRFVGQEFGEITDTHGISDFGRFPEGGGVCGRFADVPTSFQQKLVDKPSLDLEPLAFVRVSEPASERLRANTCFPQCIACLGEVGPAGFGGLEQIRSAQVQPALEPFVQKSDRRVRRRPLKNAERLAEVAPRRLDFAKLDLHDAEIDQ